MGKYGMSARAKKTVDKAQSWGNGPSNRHQRKEECPMKPSERALINLLLRGYESKDLEYKGPTQWDENNKKACCELIKDVMAMANTNGGFIVIGVSEAPNGFSWKGLSLDQLSTYDTTRFNRSLQ